MEAFESKDYVAAFPVIFERAQQGHAEAQCLVGGYFHLGLGRNPDLVEAQLWYLRAAEHRYSVALNNLGTMCLQRGDEEGARAWFAAAREAGFAHSVDLPAR